MGETHVGGDAHERGWGYIVSIERARLSDENVATLQAMAEDAMWGWARRIAFKASISPEIVFGLCEDLIAARAGGTSNG